MTTSYSDKKRGGERAAPAWKRRRKDTSLTLKKKRGTSTGNRYKEKGKLTSCFFTGREKKEEGERKNYLLKSIISAHTLLIHGST